MTEFMQLAPHSFPNLWGLNLLLPTTEQLCNAITGIAMAGLRLKKLIINVNYEFESSLLNALCGRPFRLSLESDRVKLAKMKEYKHWKGFLNYLNVEIPAEELDPEIGDRAVDSEPDQSQAQVGLGSFKHLRDLSIVHFHRTVHLPLGDLHWNNPDVQVNKKQWSSIRPKFPNCILLEELVKLKGVLKRLNLWEFDVRFCICSLLTL
jgi:hypothetical protein